MNDEEAPKFISTSLAAKLEETKKQQKMNF